MFTLILGAAKDRPHFNGILQAVRKKVAFNHNLCDFYPLRKEFFYATDGPIPLMMTKSVGEVTRKRVKFRVSVIFFCPAHAIVRREAKAQRMKTA